MSNLFEEHQYQRRLLPWLLVAGIWTASISHIYKNGISTEHKMYDILILLILPLTINLLLFFLDFQLKLTKNILSSKWFRFIGTSEK
jgi:hypothetical protein